jgi:hypothetical protein
MSNDSFVDYFGVFLGFLHCYNWFHVPNEYRLHAIHGLTSSAELGGVAIQVVHQGIVYGRLLT